MTAFGENVQLRKQSAWLLTFVSLGGERRLTDPANLYFDPKG